MPGGSSARERADARINQQRVIEAAREVFAARGADAEIKEIAERAGVGVATVYRAFGSKEGLLASAASEARVSFERLIAAAEAEPDAVAALRIVLTGAFERFDRFGWLLRLVLADPGAHRAVMNEGDAAASLERIRALLARGIESGAYRRDLPIDVALVLIRGGLISLSSTMPAKLHPGREEMIEGIISLLRPPDR